MNHSIFISEADLYNPEHTEMILSLLRQYAKDIAGGQKDLSDYVKENLIKELKKIPTSIILLAFENEIPIGLCICFEGFSTFYAKPLLNIHDFVVSEPYRGRGIARLLLTKLEELAKERGYCKLTLEVLEGNTRAQKVYKDFGFNGYRLDSTMGKALFWDKKLYLD